MHQAFFFFLSKSRCNLGCRLGNGVGLDPERKQWTILIIHPVALYSTGDVLSADSMLGEKV